MTHTSTKSKKAVLISNVHRLQEPRTNRIRYAEVYIILKNLLHGSHCSVTPYPHPMQCKPKDSIISCSFYLFLSGSSVISLGSLKISIFLTFHPRICYLLKLASNMAEPLQSIYTYKCRMCYYTPTSIYRPFIIHLQNMN